MVPPVNVVLQSPERLWLGLPETAWAAIAAIASILVAAATFVLARYTYLLAKETRGLIADDADERFQVERHHQQSMMPLITLEADCIPDNTNNYTRLTGRVRNVGNGLATATSVFIAPSLGPRGTFSVQPLGAGDDLLLEISWEKARDIPIMLDNIPYDAAVIFSSVFETRGLIRLHSHSGKGVDLVVKDVVLPGKDSSAKVDAVEQEMFKLGALIGKGPIRRVGA